MASFDLYAPKLKQLEGGFVNDPADKGGATNMGVTLNTYRTYFGQSRTVEDLKHITNGEWRLIMKGRFWDRVKADQIRSQSVAEIFVDWVINSGTNGIKNTQKLFGLATDGLVGPKTLTALNSNPKVAFDRIKAARISYYKRLADENYSQRKFLKGWLNRVNSFTYEG